jgi:hypothetical protein
MRLGPTGGDDLVSYLFGEWNIHQIVAMNMADFAPPHPKFRPPEAMSMGGNTFPA